MTTRTRPPHLSHLALLLALGLGTLPVRAEPPAGPPLPPGANPGRYTLHPSGQGVVRLDTETGEISFCSEREGAWSCRPVPETEQALRRENERLAAENQRLKEKFRKLEDMLGTDRLPPPETGPGDGKGRIELPAEEDIDKAFDYFESMVRKFRERLKRFEQEPDREPPPPRQEPHP